MEEQFGSGVDPGVRDAVEAAIRELEGLGATVRPIGLEHADIGIPTYYMLAPAECSSNLSRFDGVRYGYRAPGASSVEELYTRSRTEGFGGRGQAPHCLAGTYALSKGYYDAYYGKAQRLRRLIADDYRRAFEEVDVIAGADDPDPRVPPRRPPRRPDRDVPRGRLHRRGEPRGALRGVRAGGSRGAALPVGLHLTADHLEEARLLNVAHRYQQATDWHLARPPLWKRAGEGP